MFFFKETATTEIYTRSLHDALPIWGGPGADPARDRRPWSSSPRRRLLAALPRRSRRRERQHAERPCRPRHRRRAQAGGGRPARSEEHTSELQSRQYLVCRLLLEKNK